MPLIGQRTFSMVIPGFPTYGPFGEAGIVYNDEFFAGEIGQVGTQFDGPGHVGKRMTLENGTTTEVYYNGVQAAEMRNPYGLAKLGIEHVKPIVTRGILIDVAGYKGVATLASGYVVTLADLRGALARQQLRDTDIRPGDALFFNFGWWRHWPDRERSNAPGPGVNREVAAWIVDRKVSMVGSDATTDVDCPRRGDAQARDLQPRVDAVRGPVGGWRARVPVRVHAAPAQGRHRVARSPAGDPVDTVWRVASGLLRLRAEHQRLTSRAALTADIALPHPA